MNHGPELTEPAECDYCGGYVNDHDDDCQMVEEPPDDLDDYRGADQ